MRLYLVRHGQTDANLENRRQSPDTPLGKFGKEQVLNVAKRLKEVKADVLLSSDWPRAKQSAEIISHEIGLPVKLFPELHEMDKSNRVAGVPDDNPVNLEYLKERADSTKKLDFNWKFKGEGESMNELLVRVARVANTLATEFSGKKIIGVSHAIFISAIVSVLILGENPDKKSVLDFMRAIKLHNTGVTILDYDEEGEFWSLVSLNDHSHLV